MTDRFDVRRRALRTELHKRRISDADTSKERMAADAVTLDAHLLDEFGSLKRESSWSIGSGMTRKAALTHAERFKASGAYLDLGRANFSAG